MYCKKCGKELKDDARFCKYCGYAAEYSAKSYGVKNSNKSKPSKVKGIYIMLVGLIIALFAVIIVLCIGMINRKSEADNIAEADDVSDYTDETSKDTDISVGLTGKQIDGSRISINKLLAEYGISRVFVCEYYCQDVSEEIQRPMAEIWGGFYFNYMFDGYTGSYCFVEGLSEAKLGEFPICYIYNGDKQDEESVIEELKSIYNSTRNNHIKNEIRNAINWLQADISDEKVCHIEERYTESDSFISGLDFEYDSKGRLIKISEFYHSDRKAGDSVELTYNENSQVDKLSINSNFYTGEFSYEYSDNMVTRMTLRDPDNHPGEKASFSYNENGDLVSISNGEGNGWLFHYDLEGNVQFMEDMNSHENLFQFESDSKGRLTCVRYVEFEDGYYIEYDDYGNIISVEYTDYPEKTEFQYDKRGNLTSIIYSDRDSSEVLNKWEYDEFDHVLIDYRGGIDYGPDEYEYDEYGRIKTCLECDENLVTYEYDSYGKLTKKITDTSKLDTIKEYKYTSMY